MLDNATQSKIDQWLQGSYDAETKNSILELEKINPQELAESFYKNLEFGTGGLRGMMGVGTNRVNKYTIGMTTQGFANYLKKTYPNQAIQAVVAYDSRNNSAFFAATTAAVFAANGIKVYLFEALRPTPELSYAIRYLHCQAGVMCTASHNPKEYNGYKAYWNDGSQLVPPHDTNVIQEVEAITDINAVRWTGGEENIITLGEMMDKAYIEMVKSLSVYPEIIQAQKDLKIVYTPIHGTGIMMVPAALKAVGFENIIIVEEQATPDGNFPTVVYPNPEESEAMRLGLEKAKTFDADILCGTDPDSDRVGIGVKNHRGEWVLLNGNQTAVLAFAYLIEARRKKGLATPQDMIISTIVTTDMVNQIAKKNEVRAYQVLTGFKWIADLIRQKEGKENYIVGGEESFGLLIGDQVRDKDAVSAVVLLCEMAAYEKAQGGSLFDKLIDLYIQYGFYYETLVSLTKKGMNGQQEIADMMTKYRTNPPQTLGGSPVVKILDYENQEGKNLVTKEKWPLDLPKSNVLQFVTADESVISARPSGTEPKIKFYVSVKTNLEDKAAYETALHALETKIKNIIENLGV